jgi:hypothetical protein
MSYLEDIDLSNSNVKKILAARSKSNNGPSNWWIKESKLTDLLCNAFVKDTSAADCQRSPINFFHVEI